MARRAARRLHVFIGTKAQYIKTAPLLRLMDVRGIDYRLIDSGQHARISRALRAELGVREPDLLLGDERDVTSVPQALLWSARIAARLGSRRKTREQIFGGCGGICVVHGDTPSTLLSTLMARRAGLRVAHLEAGLRSFRMFHPFPEELIRIAVMRASHVLFAPDSMAVETLRKMGVKGRVVPVPGNTSLEALRHALGDFAAKDGGPVIATMHRVENLHNGKRVEGFVRLLVAAARHRPLRFVMHGPTVETISRSGAEGRLREAGIEMLPLQSHNEFAAMLRSAPFVITDGGSIQEECALLGVPTLIWRDRSERPDGLGKNVVLSHYDPQVSATFLADPERHRRPASTAALQPSGRILEELLLELEA